MLLFFDSVANVRLNFFIFLFFFKIKTVGSERWLGIKTLAALLEDLDSISSTHIHVCSPLSLILVPMDLKG